MKETEERKEIVREESHHDKVTAATNIGIKTLPGFSRASLTSRDAGNRKSYIIFCKGNGNKLIINHTVECVCLR